MDKSSWRARGEVRRVQIFVSDLGATGVVRNAVAIANEAAACGYQVRLLTCDADGVLRKELSPAVAVVKLNGSASAASSRRARMRSVLMSYRRHCRAWKPDILMSAGNHGHLLSTIAWLGLPGRKLLRISNDLTHGSRSLLARATRAAKFWVVGKFADRLVYVSLGLSRHALPAGQLSSGKALAIPNGVDLERVRARARQHCDLPWEGKAPVPVVLAVGRFVRQKNFDTLLKAFALARRKRPMRLAFLGDGSKSEVERMKALAQGLGVGPDVEFIAPVENPFPYMRSSSVLVLPSLWEGSSNVILEALACGTPVVASRTAGDAPHVLGDGKFGLLVDPLDVDGLAQAILRQTGPDPVLPLGRAEQFSRSIALRCYMRLFDAMLDPGGSAMPLEGGTNDLSGADSQQLAA